jgi:fructose-1,6-bisphosphatase II
MNRERINRNVSLDLVRATEAAALSAGRWMGLGHPDEADHAATQALAHELDRVDMDGYIVIGEEGRAGIACDLPSGRHVGTGNGPQLDVVIDAVDGRRMLAQGRSGAIAVAAVAPHGALWRPTSAIYMEKLVVNRSAANALVPECLDAPAAWTLALVARAKQKQIRDLVVFVLDRPRHVDLIEEIRTAGARVMLRGDGDISGAVMAASPDGSVDVLMGIGGAPEGVIAACAVKSSGGAMLVRLAPQSEAEHAAVEEAGLDLHRILTCNELVTSSQVFFTATGITDGPLLAGVRYHGDRAETHSLILRCETGTRRTMHAEHLIAEDLYAS